MIQSAAAAILLSSLVPASRTAPQSPGGTTYFLGLNYGSKAPSDPLYAENEFSLFYPEGGCPISMGCSGTQYPVFVFIRGGNSNNPLTSPGQIPPICETLRQAGFIVAIPSYHVVDVSLDQDYLLAARDLGRMVQYLRRFRVILNLDPNRLFCFGHSGGGFYSYFLGLNADFQNPASSDLVEWESSRPNFIAAWGTLTDWTCMDLANPATNPALAQMFLSASDPDAEMHASPTYWLQNPGLYGCPVTPPMCLVYNLNWQTPCGQITDFHDGFFGTYMMSMLKRFCGGSGTGQAVCSESALIDSSADLSVVTQGVVDWVKARAF